MTHFFDVDVAKQCGIECAVIFQCIGYWVQHNKENNLNFFDGCYWTYNSSKAFENTFPYMSYQKIGRELAKLEELGLIKSGNYNKSPFDRTKWYTLTEVGYRVFINENSHLSELINGDINGDKPIPLLNTYIYTDNKQINTISKDIVCQSEDWHGQIEDVVAKWNEVVSPYGLPTITRMTPRSGRYRCCRARLVEYGKDDVIRAIEMIPKCPFLLGMTDSKSQFNFTFDWFVRPNNFPKVLEGNYLSKEEKQKNANDNHNREDDDYWQY